MKRRSFLGWLGAAAATTPVAAAVLTLDSKAVAAATVPMAQGIAELATVAPGTRHFAILMNYNGQAVRTMMVDNLPQEIHVTLDGLVTPAVFRLVSKDRYDGRTIEGLARYILLKGNVDWPVIKLGF